MADIKRFLLPLLALTGLAAALHAEPRGKEQYENDILFVLEDYCYNCHGDGANKGGFHLDSWKSYEDLLADKRSWAKIKQNLNGKIMPPADKDQPSLEDRARVAEWIENTVFHVDCDNPDPGRVTIRRLNRTEYNNTIRDLVGVDFEPADDFPTDDTGHGFDNIGEALSMSPLLMEKYLMAAEQIVDKAIVINHPPEEKVYSHRQLSGGDREENARRMNGTGEATSALHTFPREGEYSIKVTAWGQQAGPDAVRMGVKVGDEDQKDFEVGNENEREFELRLTVPKGRQSIEVVFLNDLFVEGDTSGQDRDLLVGRISVYGPKPLADSELPESHLKVMVADPSDGNPTRAARKILQNFANRAYRRVATDQEIDRLMEFYAMAEEDGLVFEERIKLALKAILVSPHFLFRGEWQPDPNNPDRVHQISEFALATRLSYFLWSTMPDEELLSLAFQGKLRENLDEQVLRMLRDPKADALSKNFAGQWLELRNLATHEPDPELFEGFERVREDMVTETEMFFSHVQRNNLNVLDLISGRYSFLNERLAKHYGIEGVKGDDFRKVKFTNGRRFGVLTHGSVLTITSDPNRTSPVKRGKWMLENILDEPPPPAPGGVPPLADDENALENASLRERLEAHREDPTCASCHALMDPLGLGFENYNAVGQWRDKDGKFAIEASGELVSGESFSTPKELIDILADSKKEQFVRALIKKKLTYALGRGIEYYDKCAIDEIYRRMEADDFRFKSLIMGVVRSVPFQYRRGDGTMTVSQSEE